MSCRARSTTRISIRSLTPQEHDGVLSWRFAICRRPLAEEKRRCPALWRGRAAALARFRGEMKKYGAPPLCSSQLVVEGKMVSRQAITLTAPAISTRKAPIRVDLKKRAPRHYELRLRPPSSNPRPLLNCRECPLGRGNFVDLYPGKPDLLTLQTKEISP